MAGLADSLLGRRIPRIALIAVLFPVPLLVVISAAIVVTVTATHGWRMAAQDCAGALLLLMALTALAGDLSWGIGLGAVVTWVVAIGLGHLRQAGSLTLAVQSAVLAGVLGAIVFTVWSRDPQAYWEQVLKDLTERARSAGIEVGPADLMPWAPVMTGFMSASAVASSLAALFLGSWWAGKATGRGLGNEFQDLRMGRVLGVVAGLAGILFLTSLRPNVDDIILVLGVGFVVQGLAVIHWHGARREWPKAWPLALYLPLALLPAVAAVEMLMLAVIGLLDNGYSLRRTSGKVV